MIKIALTDDHRLVTEGFTSIINDAEDMEVVACSKNIAECEMMLREHDEIDVLLLDISMPDGNSIDYLKNWRKKFPKVHVVIISSFAEAAVIKRAMENGADGYILKSASEKELHEGIRTVALGDKYLCQDVEDILKSNPHKESINLTPREREVLKLTVEGYSMKMIADELNLSFETVHSYFKYIKLKMGVNNTAAVVRIAIEQGLV